MKKNLISLAVAGVLGLTAISASAEDMFEGAWYGLAGVGDMFHTDSDLDAKNNNLSGFIRLGKEISEHCDVQLGLSYSKADEDSNAFHGGDYKQTLFGVDALYMFSRDKFRPFLLAGLGGARNKIDYNNAPDASGSKTSWMGNVGLGFQYLFTDTVGMQADLRHVWSRAEADNGLFGSGSGHDTKTIGNDYLNIGLLIRFPPPKKVVAAMPEPVMVAANMDDIAPYDDEPLPPLQEQEAPPPCKPTAETITIQAETLFGFDKHDLKAEGKAVLDQQVVAKMKEHPDFDFVLITGHTDRIGTDAYNQKLSERRANQVMDYLVSQGVDASHLKAVGKGESEPVADCKGVRGKKLIECLAPNRRVVLDATHTQEVGCQ